MENTDGHQQHLNQVTLMGMLVAIGIVFGDIGASPLYTFSALIGSKPEIVGLRVEFQETELHRRVKQAGGK